MRPPKILTHILDSNSKSVTFGWILSLAAHAFFVLYPDRFKVENWVAAQAAASALIAQKSIKEGMIEHAAASKETSDAPVPPAV